MSATAAPDGAPAGAAGADSTGAAAAGAAGAAAGAAGADSTAVSSGSSSTTSESESAIVTRASSRPTLYTVTSRPENSGSFRVLAAMFASVGELPRPTSTSCSTPRPPMPRAPNIRFCVSIQRTGEANCHESSSVSSRRPSFWSSAA